MGNVSDRWMAIEDDSPWAGKHLQQRSYSSPPTTKDNKTNLFKISRSGDTDKYIIRSMLNNNLTISVSGDEIVTKEIPSADEDVSSSDKFFIEWANPGYVLRPVSASNKIIRFNGASPGSNLIVSTISGNLTDYSNLSSYSKWTLEKYTGAHFGGNRVFRPENLNPGQQVEFTVFSWYTGIDYNTLSVSIAPGYEDNATVVWDPNTHIATIDLHLHGEFKITVDTLLSSGIMKFTQTNSYTVTLVLEEGTYFIKNKQRGYYMQVNDSVAPNYTDPAMLDVYDLTREDYQKWNLEHIVDGYYKITYLKSGLVVSVYSNMENTDNAPIIQEDNDDLDIQLWKITVSTTGGYVLRPKSAENYTTDWCVSIHPNSEYLVQTAYTLNSDYADEWIFFKQLNATLLAFNDIDEPPNVAKRNIYFSETTENLNQLSNGITYNVVTNYYTSCTKASIINYLNNSDLFIIHSHGNQDLIVISDTAPTIITNADIANENLTGLDIALLLTCKNAQNYSESHITNNTPVNMVEQMVVCGAETVIGFKVNTWTSNNNNFAIDLTEALMNNYSVNDAIFKVIDYSSSERYRVDTDMEAIVVVAGNSDNKLG